MFRLSKMAKAERAAAALHRSADAYSFILKNINAPRDCFGCSVIDIALLEIKECVDFIDFLNIRAFPRWAKGMKEGIAAYRKILKECGTP